MKRKSLISLSAAALFSVLAVSVIPAVAQQPPAGKIHGHITDPAGTPKTAGTVSLSQDEGHTMKFTFPVTSTGDYKGEGITPGTYSVILRMPETPAGQFVDQILNVKIVANEDVLQDIDMSRKEYIDKMTPEQKKQLEEFKKKNAEVMKGNQVIKSLNADLQEARAANHDKKYDVAEALMLKDTAAKPDGELLWYELAIAQVGLKKWEDAEASLKKSMDLGAAEKKPSPELLGGAHSLMGEILARNKKPTEAAAAYDEAAKANPSKAGFYYGNETIVFSQIGDADGQVAAADKAIAADPNNPIPYYLKGQGLAGKITVDPKTGAYITPPGMVEAYNKYLELAPNGQFVNDVKAVMAATGGKVESKYKANKK